MNDKVRDDPNRGNDMPSTGWGITYGPPDPTAEAARLAELHETNPALAAAEEGQSAAHRAFAEKYEADQAAAKEKRWRRRFGW